MVGCAILADVVAQASDSGFLDPSRYPAVVKGQIDKLRRKAITTTAECRPDVEAVAFLGHYRCGRL